MIETIVLSICILGSECGMAAQAYYTQSLEAQRIANEAKTAIEHKIGQENTAIVGSMVGVIVYKRGSINMQRHLNLLVDNNSAILQAHFEQ